MKGRGNFSTYSITMYLISSTSARKYSRIFPLEQKPGEIPVAGDDKRGKGDLWGIKLAIN